LSVLCLCRGPKPEIPEPVDENSELLAAIQLCEIYEESVYATKVNNRVFVRDRFHDLPVIMMDSDLSPQHMNAFYRRSEAFYLANYPLNVSFTLDNGATRTIPVTPEQEANVSIFCCLSFQCLTCSLLKYQCSISVGFVCM
jgi:hypothetical protein